ncbi:mechanosensitive ion channel family protein [Corynebacterium kalidii]|uniref:mechanosensitive ion channel family protein n=1 Tax=Corynebacterium kalidii TaxID=2931982 RepID=UPI0021083176|nr:mechanosensitive ion channel domain-containing protein [Corynebacterium kalidii]
MNVSYFFFSLWDWGVQHGLPLAALLIVAILIPRVGRQVVRVLTDRLEHGQEETKAKLALVGALVYMLEIVAYFVVVLLALTNLGVPAMGAAIPATVVSAAIGFGSQNIIGDFLTGFFIISERHYGVGDVVMFDDTNSQVTGTVVKLTLRSTQIRTLAGELVTVPNSKASVTTNYSQTWSRAVIDLDIPMTDNESMADLLTLVEDAAQSAIDSAGVGESIRGEIEVQPALSITPPAAAGLPWSVGMRIGVDTDPAMQWAVERAIRANLVNVFWDRYQAPGEAMAARAELELASHTDTAARPHHPTTGQEDHEDDSANSPDPSDTDRVVAAATAGSDHMSLSEAEDADGVPDADDAATQVLPSPDASGPGRHAAETTATAATTVAGAAGTESDADDTRKAELGDLVHGPYDSKAKNVLSVGGRFRPSTAGLIIALVVVGLLALFSSNPDDSTPGWLAPDRWRGTAATTSETTGPTETPATSDAPAEPQNPEPATTPEDTENTQDPADSGSTDTGNTSGDTQDSGSGTGSRDNPDSGTTNTGDSTGNTDSGTTGTGGTGGTDGATQNQGQASRLQNDTTTGTTGGQSTAP